MSKIHQASYEGTAPPTEAESIAQERALGLQGQPDIEMAEPADPQRSDTLPTTPLEQPKPPAQEATPGKLAGKFDTKEDLERAYIELEKKLGGAPSETPKTGISRLTQEGKADEAAPETPPAPTLDFNKYADEWNANDTLSEDSRKELVAHGIPETIIDQYVQGLAATREQYVNRVMGMVGGEDEYAKMFSWMKSGVSDAERDAFFDIVTSGQDMRAVEMAMKGMQARYLSSPQGNTSQIVGRADPSPTVVPFKSAEARIAAQMDPRYDADPAYREEVDARIIGMDPKFFNVSTNSR